MFLISFHSIRSIFHLLNNSGTQHNRHTKGIIARSAQATSRKLYMKILPLHSHSPPSIHPSIQFASHSHSHSPFLQERVNIWYSNQNVSTTVHSMNLFIYIYMYMQDDDIEIKLCITFVLETFASMFAINFMSVEYIWTIAYRYSIYF